jgi:hypothetical protein
MRGWGVSFGETLGGVFVAFLGRFGGLDCAA